MAAMDPSVERALRLREHVVGQSEMEAQIAEQTRIVEHAVARLQGGNLTAEEVAALCDTIDHGARVNERLRLRVQRELDAL